MSIPMVGGEGAHSYTNNSSLQRSVADSAKALVNEAIAEKLDVKQLISLSSSPKFSIADLGCSVGPNTFIAVQNIIESVKFACKSHGLDSEVVEFQAFFSDHASNDFNTLFKSLPHGRQYFAAGVPGSFHGRLFPKASLHFAYSSYSLQWLSKVPQELVDKQSPRYNPTPQEIQTVIEKNGRFSIEKMETFVPLPMNEMTPERILLHLRAAWGGQIKEHFGSEINNILFDRFIRKGAELPIFSQSGYKQFDNLFILLKGKAS